MKASKGRNPVKGKQFSPDSNAINQKKGSQCSNYWSKSMHKTRAEEKEEKPTRAGDSGERMGKRVYDLWAFCREEPARETILREWN